MTWRGGGDHRRRGSCSLAATAAVTVFLRAATSYAFASSSPSPRRARPPPRRCRDDAFDFDPFTQSPLSFGEGEAGGAAAGASPITGEPSSSTARDVAGAEDGEEPGRAAPRPPARDVALAVDDAAPVGGTAGSDLFDPLLSPHAYAHGTDAGPTTAGPLAAARTTGVLLIDHGSKRQASNDHIHDVARVYAETLNRKSNNEGGGPAVVRAAHMEIAAPSIVDSLRDIVTEEGVDKVVCVPYFLSPGRHATEDIPQLIKEAEKTLTEEGFEVEIVVSGAVGTQLNSMLSAVDALVEGSLN